MVPCWSRSWLVSIVFLFFRTVASALLSVQRSTLESGLATGTRSQDERLWSDSHVYWIYIHHTTAREFRDNYAWVTCPGSLHDCWYRGVNSITSGYMTSMWPLNHVAYKRFGAKYDSGGAPGPSWMLFISSRVWASIACRRLSTDAELGFRLDFREWVPNPLPRDRLVLRRQLPAFQTFIFSGSSPATSTYMTGPWPGEAMFCAGHREYFIEMGVPVLHLTHDYS